MKKIENQSGLSKGGTGIPVTVYYFSSLVFLHFSLDLLIFLIGTTSNDHVLLSIILFPNSNIN